MTTATITDRPPTPREHGAWGILLVPFATAVGVARDWNLPAALLLVSVLCFYVARTSWLKRQWKWMALFLAGSVLAAAPLLRWWKLWWLPVFAMVAGILASRPTGRTVAEQLAGMAGLTLTAPAAWYVLTGRLDATAWWLWLLNLIYFAGGIFYVRMHLDTAILKRPTGTMAERLAAGRANVSYHLGAAMLVLALAAAGKVTWQVTMAFAPMVARALGGTVRLTPVLRIKRLGWTEVAHSVLFAVLLIVCWRR
jgi:hypothetical protein